jgi:carbonic anhydrase/acetyltransferase-like protein (isoleucine patch superfamily)
LSRRYKRRNPTQGGFVSYQASVDDTEELFIARTAAVCGGSNIQDSPKIFGTSVIRNAKISGSAEINCAAIVENGAEVTDEARITKKCKN